MAIYLSIKGNTKEAILAANLHGVMLFDLQPVASGETTARTFDQYASKISKWKREEGSNLVFAAPTNATQSMLAYLSGILRNESITLEA